MGCFDLPRSLEFSEHNLMTDRLPGTLLWNPPLRFGLSGLLRHSLECATAQTMRSPRGNILDGPCCAPKAVEVSLCAQE
jgi:hypothetical protein